MFYTYRSDTCLELDLKSVQFGSQAPGLNDTPLARAFDERHQAWRSALPKESGDLWGVLETFDADSRDGLFAHCVSLSVNAVHEAWNRRPRAFAHADRLAQAVDLDLAVSWTPTAANFLGRVTKARILQAIAEGKGQRAADRIEYLKKVEMATQAGDAARRLGLAARAAAHAGSRDGAHGRGRRRRAIDRGRTHRGRDGGGRR